MLLFNMALGQAQDLALGKLFPMIKRIRSCERDVRVWEQHREIPVLGWLLRKQVPHQGKIARIRNREIVKRTRQFVDTKTFEHVIAIAFRKFNLNRLKPKPKPTRQARIDTVVRLPFV